MLAQDGSAQPPRPEDTTSPASPSTSPASPAIPAEDSKDGKHEDVSPTTTGGQGTTKEINIVETHPRFHAPGLDHVTLVKKRRKWSYLPGIRLEHNLHWACGLLETANSGDFAANVWNDVPVPVFVIVLMAIGGTIAAVISVFALLDGIKAWHNVKFLQKQRQLLQTQRSQQLEESHPTEELDVLIDITRRELYTEKINRWGMDVMMGGGAVLISIGTFMAIGGANKKVFLASNILSGYLGNAPIAIFGLVNCAWGIYMCSIKRAHQHAAIKKLPDSVALSVVRTYCFRVRFFFIVNGISTFIGGVGSMLTATQWWAYIILVPVMIASFFTNYWWRSRVGYDRPVLNFPVGMDKRGLIEALEFANETSRLAQQDLEAAMTQLAHDPTSLEAVLRGFVDNGLFEPFSVELIKNKEIQKILCGEKGKRAEIEVQNLVGLPEYHQQIVLDMAKKFLEAEGPALFEHRTRFLAEALGTYLAMTGDDKPKEEGASVTETEKSGPC
ncbi:hypothetical protein BGZ63DRAFT_429124 [Mariannaea sp. PMI_226]|nr:hypothetical protein BGZ63DRAFT_429124 [Mariannaea sp. PMI_226]